jgi:hypothetical protein
MEKKILSYEKCDEKDIPLSLPEKISLQVVAEEGYVYTLWALDPPSKGSHQVIDKISAR